jgi:hypothetical protein
MKENVRKSIYWYAFYRMMLYKHIWDKDNTITAYKVYLHFVYDQWYRVTKTDENYLPPFLPLDYFYELKELNQSSDITDLFAFSIKFI